MNKSKIILLSTLAVLSLTACSSKSETSPQSVAETPAPVVTSTPIPTATPIPDNHDFDNTINTFKDENNIEINPDDNGTDIADILGYTGNEILYDWLYNNGVTRESVQNDRDSGCKNPYLDGYLEYLDNLDKPSETPSNTKIDFSKADAVHDSSEFGGNAGGKVYEINGHYYLEDGLELAKDADGNWAVLVPDLGEVDNITKEEIDESTQRVVDGFESGDWKKYIGKYGN